MQASTATSRVNPKSVRFLEIRKTVIKAERITRVRESLQAFLPESQNVR